MVCKLPSLLNWFPSKEIRDIWHASNVLIEIDMSSTLTLYVPPWNLDICFFGVHILLQSHNKLTTLYTFKHVAWCKKVGWNKYLPKDYTIAMIIPFIVIDTKHVVLTSPWTSTTSSIFWLKDLLLLLLHLMSLLTFFLGFFGFGLTFTPQSFHSFL